MVLESPYRRLLEPLLSYIRPIDRGTAAERGAEDRGAAVRAAPLVAPLLHSQTAVFLRWALMFRGIVIIDVPYHVGADVPDEGA